MSFPSLVDKVLPGPGSRLDQVARTAQSNVRRLISPRLRFLLHGNDWLGHPLHPVVVAAPLGAWTVTGWYDARSIFSGDPRHQTAADAALRVGIVGALAGAATGAAQFLDTDGVTRREALVHAALNNAAVTLYLGSLVARRAGHRPLGVKLAMAALGVVSASGYLGGDLSFRHGVGMQAPASL